jgi:chorismate mutase-like protein
VWPSWWEDATGRIAGGIALPRDAATDACMIPAGLLGSTFAVMTSLADLRARIDDLDRELVRVVAERLAVCNEVARLKEDSDTPIIQPDRVRDVIDTRRQWAIDAGVDPDFAEQFFRVLLTETHRIEVARARREPAPEKEAVLAGRGGLDTVASRIDHVVVTVEDLERARTFLVDRLGFREEAMAEPGPGLAVVAAGGVRIVLVAREAGPEVAAYLDRHGGGVQHIAIEVLNARYARSALEASGAPLLTDIVVDAHGHEQFFTVHDPATGVQLGFLSRTGHRVGFGATNVRSLFEALTE